jgi:hypothetical protein
MGIFPPGAGVPVSGHSGGPGLPPLFFEIVEVVVDVVGDAVLETGFFVVPLLTSKTTSRTATTTTTAPIPAPQRWFFVQLVG